MTNDPTKPLNPAEEANLADNRSTRRDVVIGGLAAATAVAAAGSEAGAQPKPGKLVQVGFAKAPGLKDVQAALADILNRNGCPACGFMGFDIRFGLLNLERVRGAEKLPGLEVPAHYRVVKP